MISHSPLNSLSQVMINPRNLETSTLQLGRSIWKTMMPGPGVRRSPVNASQFSYNWKYQHLALHFMREKL